jgi:hypothetical protein
MTQTYNPFDLEKPVIKLGDHGEWTLGDITDTRAQALAKLSDTFESFADRADAKLGDVVEIVVELCEAALEEPEGFAGVLRGLCDESQHGAKALGAHALNGLVAHIMGWLADEQSVGEG